VALFGLLEPLIEAGIGPQVRRAWSRYAGSHDQACPVDRRRGKMKMMAPRGRDISAQRCCTAICGGSGTHAANRGGALGLGLLVLGIEDGGV
jgi:hypothetical protein